MELTDRVREDPAFTERYDLGARIGVGGMGEVHHGVQKSLGRRVAIKFLTPALLSDPDYRDRFVSEARLAAELIHPNIVAVFDSGFAGGVPFLVTELVDGRSLAEMLSGGPLKVQLGLAVAGQILEGLDAVHRLGIVHRDLKPSNILVTRATPPVAKIVDFGIAKNVSLSQGNRRTDIGVVLGTPGYIAPEQTLGAPLTLSADLYAFSVMLCEMTTGKHPFPGDTTMDVIQKQIHEEPTLAPDLYPPLGDLLRRGLAKKPGLRPADAREFKKLLDELAPGLQGATSFLQTAAVAIRSPDEPRQPTPAESAVTLGVKSAAAGGAPAGRPTDPTLVTPPGPPAVPASGTAPWAPGEPEVAPGPSRRRWWAFAAVVALLFLGISVWTARSTRDRLGLVHLLAPEEMTWSAQVNDIMALIDRNKLEEATQKLFILTRGQPQLSQLSVREVGSNAFAQIVDLLLLSIVDRGISPDRTWTLCPRGQKTPKFQKMPEALADGPEFVTLLIDLIKRSDFANALHLCDRFLGTGPEGDLQGTNEDLRSLHVRNALQFLAVSLHLRMAVTPDAAATAITQMRLHAAAHPDHPISSWVQRFWSGLRAEAGLTASVDPDRRYLGSDWGPAKVLSTNKSGIGLWLLATGRYLAESVLPRSTVPREELRRLLLVSRILWQAQALANRPRDREAHGTQLVPLEKRIWKAAEETTLAGLLRRAGGDGERISLEVSRALGKRSLDYRTQLPRKLLAEVATVLAVDDPELIAAVKRDRP
ncbi:MAG: serine/threonine protein kinase [Candidatus Riflebacteria bacterium]|nr:serine/threonine protein kinase [Candidatus Riflebacteria bacterium]